MEINVSERINEQDYHEMLQIAIDRIKGYQSATDKEDFVSQAEQDVVEENVATNDDETPPVSTEEPDTPFDCAQQERQAAQQFQRTKAERTPASSSDVNNAFGAQSQQSFNNARRKAAESRRTAWADRDVVTTQGVVTRPDGSVLRYKGDFQPVDWGKELCESPENVDANFNLIRRKVTGAINQRYGGCRRMTIIAIYDGQLIINGVMYAPSIEPKYLSRLPLDTADYFKDGRMAYFYDFSSLRHMGSLYSFECDDKAFFVTNIGADLKLGLRIGVSSLFKVCPALEILTIGGESINRDDLHNEKSVDIKESLNREKRQIHLFNGLKHDICGGTQGIQDFFFSSVKNYAINRGDKGFCRYALGTVVRGTAAAAATVVNVGSHLLAGVFGIAKQVFKDGMTPVQSEDLGQ